MLRHTLLPLLVACLSCSGTVLAAPMYQVTDDKGNVTYTDKPPADGGAANNSKAIEQKPLNVLESQPGTDYQKSFDRHQTKAKEARNSAWSAYDKTLQDAQRQLESARAAQKAGETIQDGDLLGTRGANGAQFSRTSEEYQERQEALKRAVQDAEANLKAVRKNKPMIHRN